MGEVLPLFLIQIFIFLLLKQSYQNLSSMTFLIKTKQALKCHTDQRIDILCNQVSQKPQHWNLKLLLQSCLTMTRLEVLSLIQWQMQRRLTKRVRGSLNQEEINTDLSILHLEMRELIFQLPPMVSQSSKNTRKSRNLISKIWEWPIFSLNFTVSERLLTNND